MWSLLRKGASPEWWAVICEACWGTALSLVPLGSSDKGIIDEEVWVGRRKDFFGNLVWGCHKFQKHPVGKHIKHVLSEAGCHISSLTGFLFQSPFLKQLCSLQWDSEREGGAPQLRSQRCESRLRLRWFVCCSKSVGRPPIPLLHLLLHENGENVKMIASD